MTEFKQYRRKQIAELREYQEGDDLTGVSVSAEDTKAGSPKPGDMIARNPKNHADQWLVAAAYFRDNFEAVLVVLLVMLVCACGASPQDEAPQVDQVQQMVVWDLPVDPSEDSMRAAGYQVPLFAASGADYYSRIDATVDLLPMTDNIEPNTIQFRGVWTNINAGVFEECPDGESVAWGYGRIGTALESGDQAYYMALLRNGNAFGLPFNDEIHDYSGGVSLYDPIPDGNPQSVGQVTSERFSIRCTSTGSTPGCRLYLDGSLEFRVRGDTHLNCLDRDPSELHFINTPSLFTNMAHVGSGEVQYDPGTTSPGNWNENADTAYRFGSTGIIYPYFDDVLRYEFGGSADGSWPPSTNLSQYFEPDCIDQDTVSAVTNSAGRYYTLDGLGEANQGNNPGYSGCN